MHKIDAPHATASNEFTDGNPATGIEATEIISKWLNTVQRELEAFVQGAGLTLDENDDTQLSQAIGLYLSQNGGPITSSYSVTVGPSGQFQTINAAMESLSRYYPRYHLVNPVHVTITLAAGFVMAEQLVFDAVDMSWVTINSTDAIVSVTEAAITKDLNPGGNIYGSAASSVAPIVAAINGGKSPFFNCVFRYATRTNGSLNRTGFFSCGAGSSISGGDIGCQNASGWGCFAFLGGVISAKNINSNECYEAGSVAKSGGVITADSIQNNSCYHIGAWAAAGAIIANIINNQNCNGTGARASANGYISAASNMYNLGAGDRGASADLCGKIEAGQVMNNTGAGINGARSTHGGVITAGVQMDNRKGASDDVTDTAVSWGGMIIRSSGSGGVSQAVGTFTASGFISA